MIEFLQDFIYQNIPQDPEKYGIIACMVSCKIYIINSIYPKSIGTLPSTETLSAVYLGIADPKDIA